jgi:Ser/Thr protein kinase RdoA (MazF antagonist)
VVDRPGERIVVKFHDASVVDPDAVRARVDAIAELAALDDQVCGPLPLDGRLATALDHDDGWRGLVTCYEYAAGDAPTRRDALMRRRWVPLPGCTRRCDCSAKSLPLVAALATVRPDWAGPTQMLHGDFNAGNSGSDDA